MSEINKIELEILFKLLEESTEEARFVFDDDFEPFNTGKNINSIILKIEEKFSIKLREYN